MTFIMKLKFRNRKLRNLPSVSFTTSCNMDTCFNCLYSHSEVVIMVMNKYMIGKPQATVFLLHTVRHNI